MPRLFLHSLYSRPDVVVTGYDDAGVIEVRDDTFIIGRTPSAHISIQAGVGGHRTFAIRRRGFTWRFHVQNEWAAARIDGHQLAYQPSDRFPSSPLEDGNVVEVLEVHTGDLVHRLRVEIRS